MFKQPAAPHVADRAAGAPERWGKGHSRNLVYFQQRGSSRD